MSTVRCPQCGGHIRLTQWTYLSIKNGGLYLAFPDESSNYGWDIYCDNDHQLAQDVQATPQEMAALAQMPRAFAAIIRQQTDTINKER